MILSVKSSSIVTWAVEPAKVQFRRPTAIRGHSAHVGQEVEVHYRWHPLYGRRVRRHYVERRVGGEVVHVEVAPGVVMVVAAWMLDPVACAGMELRRAARGGIGAG